MPIAFNGEDHDSMLASFGARRRSSLLVIEDALIDSTIVSRIGIRNGFTTKTARCYADAIDLLKRRRFDCITLDLGLGDETGIWVLDFLAELHSKASIVIVSGAEQETCDATAHFGRSIGLNIRCSIQKPVALGLLSETMAGIKSGLWSARMAPSTTH